MPSYEDYLTAHFSNEFEYEDARDSPGLSRSTSLPILPSPDFFSTITESQPKSPPLPPPSGSVSTIAQSPLQQLQSGALQTPPFFSSAIVQAIMGSRAWWNPPPIALEPHNPSWASEFQIAKSMLENLLSDLPIKTIDHVGSTAIPDLLAKPILDIDIVISAPDFPAVLQRMKDGGYHHLGECHLPGRHAFWQPGSSSRTGEPLRWVEVDKRFDDGTVVKQVVKERRRNTYVCFEGALSLRNHRDLKRVLLEDAELRKEYGDRKGYLVNTLAIDDVEEYCFGKNEIVQKILKKAGWNDEDLAIVCKTGWYRM